MNERIRELLREAHEEEGLKTKLCLIEDIIKVKKLLWSFGHTQHNEFLSAEAAGKLFDDLYELDTTALEIINKEYAAIASQHAAKNIHFL